MLIHERLLNLVKQFFPDTPIYPTLGNHDAHPVNTYIPINLFQKKVEFLHNIFIFNYFQIKGLPYQK